MEPKESFVKSTIREVKEETGLDIADLKLCGVKQWTQRDDSYRYIVFFYKTSTFSGKLKSSEEGKVFWIPRNTLTQYTLVDDFLDMVKVFEEDELSEFYYYKEDGDWKLKLL